MASASLRCARVLLETVLGKDDPLVGDILEEFDATRSTTELWKQVFAALWYARARPRDDRPLGISADPHAFRGASSPSGSTQIRRRVNLSGVPVASVGGLGLAAIALLITVVVPDLWWVVLAVIFAGVALGAAFIVAKRWFPARWRQQRIPSLFR